MFRKWYRSPRTTQERRANGTRKDHEAAKWRRAKRSASNVDNAWDDKCHGYQKSWKKLRKTQYRFGGRGDKHVVRFEAHSNWYRWTKLYAIEEYFKEHGISYNIRDIREKKHYRRVVDCEYRSLDLEHGYYKSILFPRYEKVKIDPPRIEEGVYYVTTGYILTYWTDKRLGLDI